MFYLQCVTHHFQLAPYPLQLLLYLSPHIPLPQSPARRAATHSPPAPQNFVSHFYQGLALLCTRGAAATKRGAQMWEQIAVNAPVTSDAPRENKEDLEYEESRVNADCA